MKLKLRVDKKNDRHVSCTLFMGEGTMLASIGSLTMELDEYQLFVAVLTAGAKQTFGHLYVEIEDKFRD